MLESSGTTVWKQVISKQKNKLKTPAQVCRTFANLWVRLQWCMEYISSEPMLCSVPEAFKPSLQICSHLLPRECTVFFPSRWYLELLLLTQWFLRLQLLLNILEYFFGVHQTFMLSYFGKTSIICILTLCTCFTKRPTKLPKNASVISGVLALQAGRFVCSTALLLQQRAVSPLSSVILCPEWSFLLPRSCHALCLHQRWLP